MLAMDEREDQPAAAPRQPICMDCRGQGLLPQPRSFVDHDGEGGQMIVPARCPSCRGTGKAGV